MGDGVSGCHGPSAGQCHPGIGAAMWRSGDGGDGGDGAVLGLQRARLCAPLLWRNLIPKRYPRTTHQE